jgi:low temperature requirement protein LtrA
MKKVTWLPLFYDLILVAIIGRATYVYSNDPTWTTFGFVFLSMLIVFVLWANTTLELLLTHRETWAQRGLIFAQVTVLFIAGLAMYRGGGISDRWGFISLGVAFLSLAGLQYLRTRHNPEFRQGKASLVVSLISAFLFGWGALFPMGYTIGNGILIAWINYPLAILFATISTFVIAPRVLVSTNSINKLHLNERFGVLFLIVLGDAFLHLLHELGYLRVLPNPWDVALTIAFVFGLWVMYYPTISEPELPHSVSVARSRVAAHFLLIASAAFSIVAYVSMGSPQDLSESTTANQGWSVLPLVGILVAVFWLTYLFDQRFSVSTTLHLLATGVVMAVGILASWLEVISWQSGLVIGAVVIVIDAALVLVVRKNTVLSQ